MPKPFVPRVGAVLSADIAVPDHEREVAFYTSVLCTGESPRWQPDLMNNLGIPIIGLGPTSEEYAHLPLHWMPHIQVADVATSVTQALALGGTELMHGKSDEGASQWAVLQDPNGAAFGLIPVSPAEASPEPTDYPEDDMPGRIAWLDLTVPDAPTTRDFYQKVVGWSVQELEMEDAGEKYADYVMLAEEGAGAAGVCHARGMNDDLPPVWLIYLPVGDIKESLRRVRDGGGEVLKERRGEEGECMYAVIQDPVGAKLALLPG